MKSFRAYVAVDPQQQHLMRSEDFLAEQLELIRSIDPGPLTWSTLGVVTPAPRGDLLYHFSTNNTVLLHFRLTERILPSAAINDLVDKEVRRLLAEEGEDRKHPTKKERAQIKSEIVAERLPKTDTKSKIIPVYILRGAYILIGATAAKQCEEILSKLRGAFGSLHVVPFETEKPATDLLKQLARTYVARDEEDLMDYSFRPGLSGTLVDTDGGKISFTNTYVSEDYIQDALEADHSISEMQVLAYTDHEKDAHPDAAFKLNKAMTFKNFKLAAGLIEARQQETREQYDDDGEEDLASMATFDANVILTAETAFGVLDAVAAFCGGRKISDQEKKAIEEYKASHAAVLERWGVGEPVAANSTEVPDDYFDDL